EVLESPIRGGSIAGILLAAAQEADPARCPPAAVRLVQDLRAGTARAAAYRKGRFRPERIHRSTGVAAERDAQRQLRGKFGMRNDLATAACEGQVEIALIERGRAGLVPADDDRRARAGSAAVARPACKAETRRRGGSQGDCISAVVRREAA